MEFQWVRWYGKASEVNKVACPETGKSESMVCAGQAECPEVEAAYMRKHVVKKGPQKGKVRN